VSQVFEIYRHTTRNSQHIVQKIGVNAYGADSKKLCHLIGIEPWHGDMSFGVTVDVLAQSRRKSVYVLRSQYYEHIRGKIPVVHPSQWLRNQRLLTFPVNVVDAIYDQNYSFSLPRESM